MYDPDSGRFTWRIVRPGASAGAECGRISKWGYREICIDRALLRANKLAFIYMTGRSPAIVDHANRVRSDDRWCNLREATHSQNAVNGSVRRNNTSGVPGVTWDADRSLWRAQARLGGVKKNLGRYADKSEAELVVRAAMTEAHGEFAP